MRLEQLAKGVIWWRYLVKISGAAPVGIMNLSRRSLLQSPRAVLVSSPSVSHPMNTIGL
jgi:hypothetical protein